MASHPVMLECGRLFRSCVAPLLVRFPWPSCLPPIIAGVTALAGLATGQLIFHVIIGASLAFAATAIALPRLQEWRWRLSVEDKLRFDSARLRWSLNESGAVQSLRLGFQVSSTADYPIVFHVESLHTTINGRAPLKKRHDHAQTIVPAHGSGWCDDLSVAIGPSPRRRSIEGSLEFSARYARPGYRLDHTLRKRFQVSVQLNESGGIDRWEWTEVELAEVVLRRHFLAV